jgi:hypothetical protein
MFVKQETDTERSLAIELVLEDIPGGGIVDPDDFKTVTTSMLEGALLGIASGVYRLFKTAKIKTGGTASAPRLELAHELKVGDVISDGVVALAISVITTGSTYDTLTFSSGSLSIYAAGTILYQVDSADTTGGGYNSLATVEGVSTHTLAISIPAWDTPQRANGIKVVLSQNSSDNLAVSYALGILTIALANTTDAKNTAALIQAAIRALATDDAFDWSNAVATGTNWADHGTTLTTPSDYMKGGVNHVRKTALYSPVGIALNAVDLTLDNKGCGILKRGAVNESLLPYYVDANIKALLPFINFK